MDASKDRQLPVLEALLQVQNLELSANRDATLFGALTVAQAGILST
jgi:hypothetical protein